MLIEKYDHKKIEEGKNEYWREIKAFEAGDLTKKPYSIVIPPPNVTGKLHIGHAWDTSIQDFLIRYKKMQGFDVCWFPGMDHAGIATQAKVEERLRNQDKPVLRHDLGREKFLEKVWEWKEEYAETIRQQWGKLGLGLDYSKEKFTLDDDLNDLVNKTFIKMYNDKLIYRGKRVINWDPAQKTALSNIEVLHEEKQGKMYHFNYVSATDGKVKLEVATTRPETMFGDVCLVVNPNDDRYKKYIGQEFINPANGDKLPVIADDYVDIEFGTGVMKCTPAHDFNDYEIGKRHKLEMPIIMNQDGTMNELCGDYNGLDRFECRKKLIKDCEAKGTFIEAKDHTLQLAISERSKAIVEPYLSDQWFVSMKPLAKMVIDAQAKGETTFFPERFDKTLLTWMENIEDWCISRQLWWGHRIPVWYKGDEVKVQVESPGSDWTQDEDVLDTWFSSQLWPFAVTGYNSDKEMFNRYFPTSTLVTGYDIIFFWVSRMMTSSLYEHNKAPFENVLIHGLVRAEDGRKMSKSLGNGIDPMDVIDEFGADALRHFLLTNSTPGQDLRYSTEKIRSSANFINKIFNAGKFIELKCTQPILGNDEIERLSFSEKDLWILDRFNTTITKATENIDKMEFVVASKYMYDFIWNDFCNWYIELVKAEETETSLHLLKWLYKQILKMMHPQIPFVTEEIYQGLELCSSGHGITKGYWPEPVSVKTENDFDLIINLVEKVREYRAKKQLGKKHLLDIQLNNVKFDYVKFKDIINNLININIVEQCDGLEIHLNFGSITIEEKIDKSEQDAIIAAELKKIQSEIDRCKKMLSNEKFTSKAPQAKIDEEKAKLEMWENKLKEINT